MAPQEGQSDAYLGAREAALSWLNANWDPAISPPVRDTRIHARQAREPGGLHGT